MYDHVQSYVNDIVAFRALEVTEQLDLVADIVAYWEDKKITALDEAGKTRVDSCLPAQRYYALEKQWANYNMNLKKKLDFETARIRAGI